MKRYTSKEDFQLDGVYDKLEGNKLKDFGELILILQNPNYRWILTLVANKPNALTADFVSKSKGRASVSIQQLNRLQKAGLLVCKKEGRFNRWKINNKRIQEVFEKINSI